MFITKVPKFFDPQNESFYRPDIRKKGEHEIVEDITEKARPIFDGLVSKGVFNNINNDEGKISRVWSIVYDFYRILTSTVDSITTKITVIKIEEAKKIITVKEEEGLEKLVLMINNTIDNLKLIKTEKRLTMIKGDTGNRFFGGDNEKVLYEDFLKHLLVLFDNPFIFIDFNKKIDISNNLFRRCLELDTSESIKKSMLTIFYDLVYVLSISSGWYDYDTVKRIVSEK